MATAPKRRMDRTGMAFSEFHPAPAPETATGNGLVVEKIGKAYGKRPVVKGVSVSLERGEVAGLLGPNGAGKTTCFYMITGLVEADYGRILLDGEDITRLPMYQRARLGIGYLPQEKSIFHGMTVEQNVLAVAEVVEKDRDARHELVNCASPTCATPRRLRCRAVKDGGWKSPAPWRLAPPSCCSTSLSRASIRLQSPISAT